MEKTDILLITVKNEKKIATKNNKRLNNNPK